MKQILILLCVISVASCGKLKRTSKIDEKTEIKTETASVIDQTTVVRSVDTLLTITADTIEGSRVIEDSTFLFFENENQSIEVRVSDGLIKARGIVKNRIIPVKATEVINSIRKEDSRSESAKNHTVVESEKERGGYPWWLWLFPIAGIIYLVWRLKLI